MIRWEDNKDKEQEYFEQYNGFYIKTLIPILEESGIQISQNFMDTSPSSGVKSFAPYVKSDVHDSSRFYGDSHIYYMQKDCEDDDTHDYYRFLSESGF